MKTKTSLSIANEQFRAEDYRSAIKSYERARKENPELGKIVEYNIRLAKQRIQKKTKKVDTIQEKLMKDMAALRAPILATLNESVRRSEMLTRIVANKYHEPDAFDEAIYLNVYPDIEEAVRDGVFGSAQQHFEMFGKHEQRVHSFVTFRDSVRKEVSALRSQINGIDRLFSKSGWPEQAASTQNVSSIPYYLESSVYSGSPQSIDGMTVAIHLHLFYPDMLQKMIQHLNNIPLAFDLFVSTACTSTREISEEIVKHVSNIQELNIKTVPNKGRDLAPFIIEFGAELQAYDAVCHIHTKKSTHTQDLERWGDQILNSLLGSKDKVHKILSLINSETKFIYPEGQSYYIKDPSGWAGNYDIAREVLHEHLDISISDFPKIEFPEGSMFWASKEGISPFLSMSLAWENFPEEPIPTDGTLAHALERIILISGRNAPGKILKLLNGQSDIGKLYYEPQRNYAKLINEQAIKILSFYLPQFHPIPENDEWHGKGFTEWTKVKTSTPLFNEHYQQHVPHSDIGYYLLDSPAVLKKQAELMKVAGVHGQIFYHYWFSGKLILEEPARMLLANKDVDMPYCFCWANENWTKRWDGNDSEVLLSQNYSQEDAEAFIRYLVPFLKDSRYITIDGRPVLYIYRPSSIPNPDQYISTWNKVCAEHGIPPLYITAIMTRGATDPRDYGMDGALERVLHDWTAGNAPEIRDTLHKYWPVNGSVLKYDDVASYYMDQTSSKDFEYFRSLVPAWDNTARYGSEAHIVHDSTPEKFQNWLESAISYTKENLPTDRQIVVINAWNEWAEGAHLEPDENFGYAYLNSVGRALSNIPYSDDIGSNSNLKAITCIEIELPDYLIRDLDSDALTKLKFFKQLAASVRNSKLKIVVSNKFAADELNRLKCPIVQLSKHKPSFKLQFRKLALITESFISEMRKAHSINTESVIISNEYGASQELQKDVGHCSVHSESAYNNSVILIPSGHRDQTFKICHKARVFPTKVTTQNPDLLSEVTTIIRFHKNDNLSELRNALLSLAAIHSCVVKPLICAQDLSQQQFKALTSLCDNFNYSPNTQISIMRFNSHNNSQDIRAKLLHDGLNAATSRYVAFLDHDDLMLSDSYSYLINRLQTTHSKATFGRVYDTTYESESERFIKRNKTYEYGFTYKEFLETNHAPLHSFMLDKSKFDANALEYFSDQKFMEDYYLTLQIFDETTTDWASLSENFYIGDYLHCTDRAHTLAITNTESRDSVITNDLFEKCKTRLDELREKIRQRTFGAN
jgi:lipopolysaccharide biosynthesis protein